MSGSKGPSHGTNPKEDTSSKGGITPENKKPDKNATPPEEKKPSPRPSTYLGDPEQLERLHASGNNLTPIPGKRKFFFMGKRQQNYYSKSAADQRSSTPPPPTHRSRSPSPYLGDLRKADGQSQSPPPR